MVMAYIWTGMILIAVLFSFGAVREALYPKPYWKAHRPVLPLHSPWLGLYASGPALDRLWKKQASTASWRAF